MGQAAGHVLLEPVPVLLEKIGVEEADLELRVELEEGAQDVLLVPGAALLEPLHRVFKRIKNIVEMNQYSIFKDW